MKKRLYYRDNYGEFIEGYVVADYDKGVYTINKKAYVRANSRCINGCKFIFKKGECVVIDENRNIIQINIC